MVIPEAVNKEPVSKSTLVSQLSNYNLPHFVLEEIASKCNSELAKKGKIGTILDSMNESALTLLHKIFVLCEEDKDGKFSDYRFAVFISSKFHARPVFDQVITGRSGVDYKVKVSAFGEQGLVCVGENKPKGDRVSIDELQQFNKMVMDISKSESGYNLAYAFYGSSVGYEKGFSKVFTHNRKTKTHANKYGYSAPKTITLLEFRDKNMYNIFSAPF